MHSNPKPITPSSKITNEYIKIYIQEVLYNQYLIQAPPDVLLEAIGVWVLCLVHCQISGKIPQNLTHLARLLRVPEKPVQRAWSHVKFDFEEQDGDHYFHRRIEAECREAAALSEKRRQSAFGRWEESSSAGGREGEPTNRSPSPGFPGRGSKRGRFPGKSIDLSSNPLAIALLDTWNQMAQACGGRIGQADVRDMPRDLDSVVEELGGQERILEAIRRIPKIPFYLGEGPHGWKASLPWLFQRKSVANLLAQSPPSKAPSTAEFTEVSETDRALLDQLREDAAHPQGRP